MKMCNPDCYTHVIEKGWTGTGVAGVTSTKLPTTR